MLENLYSVKVDNPINADCCRTIHVEDCFVEEGKVPESSL